MNRPFSVLVPIYVIMLAACMPYLAPYVATTPAQRLGSTPAATIAPTLAPAGVATILPTTTALPAVTPTITVPIGYALTPTQLALLGAATAPLVKERSVVIEWFQTGVMVVFAKAAKGFDASGGEYIFALARNGSAWRVADTFVETSKNSDNWYTCDRKPGMRPEKSGVPWRGFGKAWCEHPEIRAALGGTRSYEESDLTASFQSFERGRAFQVSDWRGIPGWNKDHVYVVSLSSSDPNFAAGRWE